MARYKLFLGAVSGATGGTSVSAGVGSLSITGYAPSITTAVSVSAGVGSLAFTGYVPTISTVSDTSVASGVGAIALTGYAPSINTAASVQTGVGALSISGLAPSITTSALVRADVGALAITGLAPTVSTAVSVNTDVGSIALTGIDPSALVIDYDYLNASADVTDGLWVRSDTGTNADLFSVVDEQPYDDADYIKTSTLDDECEIGLEAGSPPPYGGYTHVQIRVPSGFSPTGGLQITLMEGASPVHQWTESSVNADTLYEYAVTNSISVYTDLRLRLKAVA